MILKELAKDIPLLYVFYSLILISGLYQIGHLVFKSKQLNNVISEISEAKYQKILISTNLILLIFYPVVLISNKFNIIPFLSISIFTFGFVNIFRNIKKVFFFRNINFRIIGFDQYLLLQF